MSTYWPTEAETSHPLVTLTITHNEAISNALGLDPTRLTISLNEAKANQ